MDDGDLIRQLKAEFEPLEGPHGRPIYRGAVILIDGLYLPCVAFSSATARVELAMRRFEETLADARKPFWRGPRKFGYGMQYPDIVTSFTIKGNRVTPHDIARIEKSPFALSAERLREVKGETSMGWTEFTARMSDGKEFVFGTTFHHEFFNMPEGYTANDVVQITPAQPGLRPVRNAAVFRERPHFECYLSGI